MTTCSKFTNLVVGLSIVLLFAFLLTSISSSVVTAGFAVPGPSVQDQDHGDHGEARGHHEAHLDGADDDHHEHEDGEHEEDEHEHDEHEHDEHAHELEEEMMEMEMMDHIFEVSHDASHTAFYAIMLINEVMEEGDAVKLLKECLNESQSDETKRAIRIKLVELNAEMDNQDGVREHMKALILEQ